MEFLSIADFSGSPSYFLADPLVRSLVVRRRSKPRRTKIGEDRWNIPVSRSQVLAYQQQSATVRYRCAVAVSEAVRLRHPVLFYTLTLDSEYVDRFFDDGRLWSRFLARLRRYFKSLPFEHLFVLDAGELRGRLHLHGLTVHRPEQIDVRAIGDPVDLDQDKCRLPQFDKLWTFGRTLVTWMRLDPSDYMAVDYGLDWPFSRQLIPGEHPDQIDTSTDVAFAPRPSVDSAQVSDYISCYLDQSVYTKDQKYSRGVLIWRTKISRNLGLSQVKKLPLTLSQWMNPLPLLEALYEMQYERPLPSRPSLTWTRKRMLSHGLRSRSPADRSSRQICAMLDFGRLSPIRMMAQEMSQRKNMLRGALPVYVAQVPRLLLPSGLLEEFAVPGDFDRDAHDVWYAGHRNRLLDAARSQAIEILKEHAIAGY